MAGQWGRLVIQLGSTMVLARLLTPGDYGLIGMVLALTALAETLKSMGLSTVTVQRRSIDQAQLSLLFWVNVGLGLAVAALVVAVAPLIARFYGQPELTGIAMGLSASFVFGGIGAQHVALLNRRMQFGTIARIEITVMLVSVVVAIVAAWFGAGYWSLVAFHALQPLTRTLLAWRRTRWMPSRPAGADDARAMLTFGANLSGFEVLAYFARQADSILVGRFLGAEQLGIYAKAYGLLLLPIQQIQGPVHRVAIPVLSKLQDEPERFRRYFCTGLRSVGFVVIPGVTFLIVAAEEVVLIVLGDQWVDAVGVFRILGIAGLVKALSHSNGWLYIALGRARRQVAWAAISAPLTVLSYVVGLRWGIEGVAAGYSIMSVLLFLPSIWNATHGTPVSIGDLLRTAQRPAAASVLGAIAATAARTAVGDAPILLSLASMAAAYGVVVAAVIALWPTARREAQETLQLVRGGFGSRP